MRRPPRSTQGVSSAASDVYKRQVHGTGHYEGHGHEDCPAELIRKNILLAQHMYLSTNDRRFQDFFPGPDLSQGSDHESGQHAYRGRMPFLQQIMAVSYTHLRAHETSLHLVCRLLLEKKKKKKVELNHANTI
eukprot:TRINITY_DN64787_c0_g1_i3.p2 TRINITY_DN64787_c0_g1~~TRINITY_DN64787_c0_g1_i3.p2  ORF type:complete len:133 (+),score=33.15 TRINITY_DN64787_c0_g1_i3:52-450(+)